MAGRGRRGCRGLPLGRHRPGGIGAAPTSGGEIPTGPRGQATGGVHRGRGGRGRGSIPPLSIPTSRSLEHDTAAASPSPSIPSGSSVPSSSSSRTMPTTHFPTPSPTSMTPLPTRPAPPATASPAASREEDVRAELEVTGPPGPPQRLGMEAPRVQGIPITLIANDTELHPSHFCARRMTKVFKRWMIPEGYCGKSVPPHHKDQYWRQWKADSSETPPSVNDLYLHLHTVNHDRTTFIDTRSERFYDRLQSRRQELTQATPEQSVDDEAVYLNVAGECSKGRVYGLGSVGRKKRRYGTPGASTSQTPDVVPRARVRCRCGATTKGLRVSEVGVVGIVEASELGGGYGGFGAGGLGAYRETDNFRLYSVSNQKRNPYSVSDRISDDIFRDGTSPSLFRF
ncbi:hypothetical protein Sjap_017557 [Stephania japonica]|uniref:Uncharacterized protein n=1 Tax=Stephania japonica TaxID=461633 RepID=A0AAP0I6E3_9MAGN